MGIVKPKGLTEGEKKSLEKMLTLYQYHGLGSGDVALLVRLLIRDRDFLKHEISVLRQAPIEKKEGDRLIDGP